MICAMDSQKRCLGNGMDGLMSGGVFVSFKLPSLRLFISFRGLVLTSQVPFVRALLMYVYLGEYLLIGIGANDTMG